MQNHEGNSGRKAESRTISPLSKTISRDSAYLPITRPDRRQNSSSQTLRKPAFRNSTRTPKPSPSSRDSSLLTSVSLPTASKTNLFRIELNAMRIGADVVFHFWSSLRPRISASEIMFLSFARDFGLERAVSQATISHWRYKRTLNALLALSNPARVVPQQTEDSSPPPSSSQASSRKRRSAT